MTRTRLADATMRALSLDGIWSSRLCSGVVTLVAGDRFTFTSSKRWRMRNSLFLLSQTRPSASFFGVPRVDHPWRDWDDLNGLDLRVHGVAENAETEGRDGEKVSSKGRSRKGSLFCFFLFGEPSARVISRALMEMNISGAARGSQLCNIARRNESLRSSATANAFVLFAISFFDARSLRRVMNGSDGVARDVSVERVLLRVLKF